MFDKGTDRDQPTYRQTDGGQNAATALRSQGRPSTLAERTPPALPELALGVLLPLCITNRLTKILLYELRPPLEERRSVGRHVSVLLDVVGFFQISLRHIYLQRRAAAGARLFAIMSRLRPLLSNLN
jgi:hypothetical protein